MPQQLNEELIKSYKKIMVSCGLVLEELAGDPLNNIILPGTRQSSRGYRVNKVNKSGSYGLVNKNRSKVLPVPPIVSLDASINQFQNVLDLMFIELEDSIDYLRAEERNLKDKDTIKEKIPKEELDKKVNEDTNAQDTKALDTKAQDTKALDTKAQDTKAQESTSDGPEENLSKMDIDKPEDEVEAPGSKMISSETSNQESVSITDSQGPANEDLSKSDLLESALLAPSISTEKSSNHADIITETNDSKVSQQSVNNEENDGDKSEDKNAYDTADAQTLNEKQDTSENKNDTSIKENEKTIDQETSADAIPVQEETKVKIENTGDESNANNTNSATTENNNIPIGDDKNNIAYDLNSLGSASMNFDDLNFEFPDDQGMGVNANGSNETGEDINNLLDMLQGIIQEKPDN